MLDKAIQKSVRADKRHSLEQKAQKTEEAARQGYSRSVYRITNEVVGKRPKTEDPSKMILDDFLLTLIQ